MRLLTILLLLFTFQNAFAQLLENDTLTVIAYWQEGDILNYELTKYDYEEKNEVVKKDKEVKMLCHFEILEETETSYRLLYQVDSFLLEDENELTRMLTNQMVAKPKYEIETTETGEWIGLANWEEVRDQIKKGADLIAASNKSMDGESMKKLLGSLLNSKEKVEQQITKEIGFLFEPYGYLYAVADTTHYSGFLPSAYTAEQIDKTGKLFFETNEDNPKVIEWHDYSAIDSESASEMVKQFLKKMVPKKQQTKEFKQEIANVKLNIEDRTELHIHTENGFMEFAEFERKTAGNSPGDNTTKIERTTFRLLSVD